MAPALRIYYGPEDEFGPATLPLPAAPNRVTVPLGELLPVLADALVHNRAWIRDFADENVTVPQDLYEVVLAYLRYNRPSA